MSSAAMKKFWSAATVVDASEGGFTVHLDARPLRTPARASFTVPVRALAKKVAAEWGEQGDEIQPETMPFTRICNAAIDNMAVQRADVVAMLAEYGATDLVCYRAASPSRLAERQAAAWDPLLGWLKAQHSAPLFVGEGVIPVAQPPQTLAQLRGWIDDVKSDFAMMALHDLVTISGSLVIAMAVADGQITPDAGWDASRIDETWQIENWGEDAEAAEAATAKRAEFLRAALVLEMVGGPR